MNDNECPQLETSTVYEGDTGEVAILIKELWVAGTDYAQVLFSVADGENAATTEMDPERALEIAAKISEAAHRALWRRQFAGEA